MHGAPVSRHFANQLATGLLDLVYPPICQLCNTPQPAGRHEAFCYTCLKQLNQLLGDQCPRCAARFPKVNPHATDCHLCHDEDYAFSQTIAWGPYDSAMRSIILRIKEQRNESLAHHIGLLFATQFQQQWQASTIDAIVPVPLHWTRRLWRGYNQAEVLGKAIAQKLHKPYRRSWLWRRLQTPLQASVTPAQRRKNLRQAMTARLPNRYQGQHILLIDDVMTTGATADACARAMLAAGAGSVKVAVLARATGETATASASPSS
jgi:ComF family protein